MSDDRGGDDNMITHDNARDLLAAIGFDGRRLGRTVGMLNAAIAITRGGGPVTLVAATHEQGSHMLKTWRELGGDPHAVKVVTPMESHRFRGAGQVLVDHHALEVALADALDREEQLRAELVKAREQYAVQVPEGMKLVAVAPSTTCSAGPVGTHDAAAVTACFVVPAAQVDPHS